MLKWDARRLHLAALNSLAVARRHLGSLYRVTRSSGLGVSLATSGDGFLSTEGR